ncbi:hypothetical protein [Achromobacter aloeverae]
MHTAFNDAKKWAAGPGIEIRKTARIALIAVAGHRDYLAKQRKMHDAAPQKRAGRGKARMMSGMPWPLLWPLL